MGNVRVLSETLANKIAAGEVIERPASIVKELVENALDAGATSVEIAVKNGGKSFIRVSDNGSGMSAEDAELAFQRHATSKIASEDDLHQIHSFGFRGEALPSIAAVSRVTMWTRLHGVETGIELSIEGGRQLSAKPQSCREGTVLEIRDLFFNTLARRKFLKPDSTELGHMLDAVSNLAMANPSIRFVFESSGRTVLDLLPGQSISERSVSILGEEAAPYLIDVEGKAEGIKIYGVIGKPYLVRANRSGQALFVNRRWIKSIGISYAVQDGFHGLLMHGQYPVCMLFIDVDAERIDVNVHPTKQEIRISKESEIKSLIRRTVAEALQKEGDLAPPLKSPREPAAAAKSMSDFAPYLDMQQNSSAFPREALKVSEPDESSPALQEETLEEPILIRDKLRITKVLGQIHHTFIIAETDEGMIVVDQHAAHEKVMFEALLKEFQAGQTKRQRLLMDEILELHPKHHEVLKQAQPFLEKIGFEVEEFGENSFVVRSYPAILKDENPVSCLKRFLEEKEEGKLGSGLQYSQEEVAALIACKRRSVKAHDVMSFPAMTGLLEMLSRCENPFHCPHGRPTIFQYSFLDLEKNFKRK